MLINFKEGLDVIVLKSERGEDYGRIIEVAKMLKNGLLNYDGYTLEAEEIDVDYSTEKREVYTVTIHFHKDDEISKNKFDRPFEGTTMAYFTYDTKMDALRRAEWIRETFSNIKWIEVLVGKAYSEIKIKPE